ncbi:hypothetical protein CMO83_02230 [Candidatus Woesearchaeota archaeon]|jgi:hypothetical protein|nr:hypothetical protein [Candidatus Woesearchaeota archaeon]|tara:strand:+ start:4378 stop:5100 length:723 start_codon:yes stop_codon:yes gene_type:complete
MQHKNFILIFLLISLFVAGCYQEVPAEEDTGEIVETGAIDIESTPSGAEIYIDNELKGATPYILYNIPAGAHKLIIKKEGYEDFKKDVSISFGRTEEIDVRLTEIIVEAKEQVIEEIPEEDSPEISAPTPALNKINLSKFATYLDFDEMLVTDLKAAKSDIFLRRYDTHIYFTAIGSAKISVINEPISDVKKDDCIFIDSAIEPLFSGQSVCVKTLEGSIAAAGSSWEDKPTELEWILFS